MAKALFGCAGPIQNDRFKMEGRPFSHQKWTPSGMGPAQPNRACGGRVPVCGTKYRKGNDPGISLDVVKFVLIEQNGQLHNPLTQTKGLYSTCISSYSELGTSNYRYSPFLWPG